MGEAGGCDRGASKMSTDPQEWSTDRHTITTRELVTIALLSSLGGTLSTFVGYLGNMVNMALGVPFGAGQFMAGLHVFWIVLIRVMVPRTGAATIGGLLKGVVELFTGSTHGIVVVVISLIQGITLDIVATVDRRPNIATLQSRLIWWSGAGIASASNVLVFQLFYFANAPWQLLVVIMLLAFCSGVIFAGYLAGETLEFLNDANIRIPAFKSLRPTKTHINRRRLLCQNIPAIVMLVVLVVGSTYYFVAIARPFEDPNSCTVTGLVIRPFVFRLSDFAGRETIIEAELVGDYIHLPPENYTGILVSIVLETAGLMPEATRLSVEARDGYSVVFELSRVMNDDRMLLTSTTDGLWLIAAQYDGAMWVRMVTRLVVV